MIIFFVVVILYYYSFIFYYQRIFPPPKSKILQTIVSMAMVILAYKILYVLDMLWLNMFVIIAIMVVALLLTTEMNWIQALHGGGFCVINAYCSRGIFTAIIYFCFQSHDFLHYADAYYMITIFALPIAFLFFIFVRKTIIQDTKLRSFLRNSNQLKLVIVYEFLCAINLTIINLGRKLSIDNLWYTEIVLVACILTIGVLVYVIYQSIRNTELLEYQWMMQKLEEQFEIQLLHYKSYQRYTESFRTFKHDYKFMMTSLKSLLIAGENEKAIELLEDIYDVMKKKVQVHKKYSDNMVLDAMMQDLANICEEEEIKFTSKVFAPKNTELILFDAIRIFSNITRNAVEACLKIPVSERFIDINCTNDQQWAMIQVVNSYNGEVLIKGGELTTTKTDTQSHGLGLGIVTKIAENLGGFVTYDMDSVNRTFEIRVHVPRLNHDEGPNWTDKDYKNSE